MQQVHCDWNIAALGRRVDFIYVYLKLSAQRFRYALFAFIHTQSYFEYYTLTLRLASLVKKTVIYAYWTKELFDICRKNVSYMAPLPSVARHVIHDKKLLVTFMQTRDMYLHFTRSNNGLTAITKMLVAGWKHASFLCYSSGSTRDSPRCFIFRATGQENRSRFSKSALLKYLFY